MLAGFLEIESCHVQVAALIHREGSRSEAPAELVEHRCVVHTRRVHDHSQNAVFERLRDVQNVLVGVHDETRGMRQTTEEDWLEHAHTQVNYE